MATVSRGTGLQSRNSTAEAQRKRRTGQDNVWLPVIVIPATLVFCLVVFAILRVG
jgi:hypothetical protein